MTDLPLLASGRDADVYALDGARVLRRYRRGGDVAAEAAVMVHVGGLGFPAPAVHQADGTDLVLERVPGPTMLSAFATGELGLVEGATVLADLHRRLHALPTLSRESGFSVLHLDLHPDNVILGPRGPVLIDWRNATEGPADLDLAMTAVIIAQVAVDPRSPFADAAGGLLPDFLRRAGGDPLSQLDVALALRGGDPNLSPDEVALLAAARTLITRA